MADKQELHDELQKLHQMLGDVDELDPATREELTQVADEIDGLLQARELGDQVEGVQGRLGELVVQFETEHPRITGILSRLADGLSGMGI